MLPIRTGSWASCWLSAAVVVGLELSTGAGPAKAQFGGGFVPIGNPVQVAPAIANAPLVPPLAELQRGQESFMRQWKAGDSHSPTGDGLGPMFNARSCADCHNMGKVGGAGTKDSNVDLLSVILPTHRETLNAKKFRDSMTQLHPAFTTGTASVLRFITLHKYSNDPAYAGWRNVIKLVAANPDDEAGPELKQTSPTVKRAVITHAQKSRLTNVADKSYVNPIPPRTTFQITHRNTPALFGVGLIDSIPDDVIRQAAKDEAKTYLGIRGKVALAGSGGVGKFGWRGQTASLKEFVMGACANELGLQVPGNDQPIDPLDPAHKSPGLDLTQDQCDDLTAFVASLPPPVQREASTAKEAEHIKFGEHLFLKTGCAACHSERLGTVTGIYSDLLLHDMGDSLADPVPANSSASVGRGPSPSGSPTASYYGGANANDVFVDVPPATLHQWRTPPLWGVADSAPYLHDGRAATLPEAILAHGGEATFARKNYAALTSQDRAKLLAFLGSLVAK